MQTKAPFVPFPQEPNLLAQQVRELGGTSVRHSFAERAFNPGLTENRFKSLAHLRGAFLMTYRTQEMVGKLSVSRLHICGVSDGGAVLWDSPLVLPDFPRPGGTSMQEDGRLFWWNGELMLAYSNVSLTPRDVKFKQSVVRLHPVHPSDMANAHVFKPRFTCGFPVGLDFGHNSAADATNEKNWQFFENEHGNLSCVYSIHPHVVLDISGRRVHTSSCDATADWTATWGDMHGGTPPIHIGDGLYLSFFNSYVAHSEHQRRYVVGAYLFNGLRHGYKVTHVTNKPLLIGTEEEGFLWDSPAHWEPIVAFVTGATLQLPYVRIAYGVNDCFAETALIPLDSIMSRMVKV